MICRIYIYPDEVGKKKTHNKFSLQSMLEGSEAAGEAKTQSTVRKTGRAGRAAATLDHGLRGGLRK